jgi:hypothetical protein
MAAKKMIPPRAVESAFGDDYDEFKLGLAVRLGCRERAILQRSETVRGHSGRLSRIGRRSSDCRLTAHSECSIIPALPAITPWLRLAPPEERTVSFQN